MRFSIQYLSFFVINNDGQEQDPVKRYKHYQTLDHFDYEDSEIRLFLDSEFTRIGKRKAEIHSETDNAPTKIGRFMLEPGHELDSNPNYNLFQKLRTATDKTSFHMACDDMLRLYMNTSAVRGGAFIVALGKLNELFDDPFVFVLKCDFESKIARISDERSLISKVEMAISARNIKSIQYPHMPEEGMLEPYELKIHQASHARYFEDFLKFVSYEKSKPEIVTDQVLEMVQQYIETKWQGDGAGSPGLTPTSDAAYSQAAEPDGAAAELGAGHAYGQEAGFVENDAYLQAAEAGRYEEERASASGPYLIPSGNWTPEKQREATQFEAWAASDKRQLQEKWTHDDVAQATARLTEFQPELDLKFKLGDVSVKAKMTEYGENVHIARMNGRYVVLIEGDTFQFEKGISPVELLYPDEIDEVLRRMNERHAARPKAEDDYPY
ncbi:DUF3900 domain-containing protein [Cohnella lubricantis]|uniref:DUF3900 domain-containing protein n=1 Tax=Cohnella lubricantis TaxID=2163172 RepID=A0A841T9F2_9BACL|nr:DUF3900 domain-containing protein [Cohnella lubricantis]MBB6676689.1 DUF3900 domain-containing protein [Cohnella lubricantis]MBP2117735.1 hypothetical protein [Cohnella lubricantis]